MWGHGGGQGLGTGSGKESQAGCIGERVGSLVPGYTREGVTVTPTACPWEHASPGTVPTTATHCETTPHVPRALQGSSRDGAGFCVAASILPLNSCGLKSLPGPPESP